MWKYYMSINVRQQTRDKSLIRLSRTDRNSVNLNSGNVTRWNYISSNLTHTIGPDPTRPMDRPDQCQIRFQLWRIARHRDGAAAESCRNKYERYYGPGRRPLAYYMPTVRPLHKYSWLRSTAQCAAAGRCNAAALHALRRQYTAQCREHLIR